MPRSAKRTRLQTGKRLLDKIRRRREDFQSPRSNAPERSWTSLESLEQRVLFSIDFDLPELLQDNDPGDAIVVDDQPDSNVTPVLDGAIDASTIGGGGPVPSGGLPFGADYRDGSEFMIGDIWVTVVLTESDGSIDVSTEDWTQAEIDQVKAEVLEGFTWWEDTFAAQNSQHSLNFFVDFTYTDNPLQTGYEAINRPQTSESLWIDDFLDEVGHNTPSSIFTDLDQWNHDQRVANSTDWAFTVFIADSSNDTNGRFSDGSHFAYAYRGGPFLQMTYDNASWGINRLGQVLAHETGHIFYALDEYNGGSSYTATSGYYGTQNLNAYNGNPDLTTRVASIMAEAGKQSTAWSNHTSSPTSLEMLGWKDSDGDGIFDVLDVPLTLTGSGSFNDSTGKYEFSGSSSVGTLNNLNTRGTRHDITTNTVDRLQYRIDGGSWLDGDFYGEFSTAVSGDVSVGSSGNHTIDFRTIVEESGLSSNIWSDTFTVAGNTPGITVSPLTGLVTSESGSTAAFSVVLNSRPTDDVVISITSNDTSEGTVSVSSLTFTAANWDQSQTVTVTGVDDSVEDGGVGYSIITGPATSTDGNYSGLNAGDVSVTNTDDDTAGITVSPLTSTLR